MKKISIVFLLYLIGSLISCVNKQKKEISLTLESKALAKISVLESLMNKAKEKSIDVTREETVMWFAKEFIKFANWDEKHQEETEKVFSYYRLYKNDSKEQAAALPDFERKKVIEILDTGIKSLTEVIDGKVKRRPVNKVDWQNIKVENDMFTSNGRPVFLYDYFSKTVGQPLTNKSIYNDHLGAIFHGGSTLYDTNKDRAINPYMLNEDGTFKPENLKLVTDIPNTNVGFMILWNMGMPDWVHKKAPELELGRSLFTGFDIDNPVAREVWSKVIRKSGELTKGKKVTQMGYILSNEPHWYSIKKHWTTQFNEMTQLSSHTIKKLRAWLYKKYNGKIQNLNTNWKANFKNFEEVTISVPMFRAQRGTPEWYDWCRYNMNRSIDWFTYLQKELRSVDPDADTSIKIMPYTFTENERSHGIDVESLTELTSMIGDDAQIRERSTRSKGPEEWESKYSYFWEEMAVGYDFLESVSPNKIHFNSESHYLSASHWRKLDTSTDYVRSTYWLSTIHGMDANLGWFWARDPDGSPEDRLEGELNFFDPALAGSYAGSVNMQPHIANEYTQIMYDLNSFSEEVLALRKQRRPIRLFYSETSAINKKLHMTQQFELYESLYFEGFPLGYATEKIINKQDNTSWDVILVKDTEYVTDSEFKTLQKYLNNGGTIILDAKSLSKNEYGKPRKAKLTKGKGELIIIDDEHAVEEVKKKALKVIAENLIDIQLTEDNGLPTKGCTWRIVEKPEGGYLMNILNIGAKDATLKISNKERSSLKITDMLTGNEIGTEFNLKVNGILLLEITK